MAKRFGMTEFFGAIVLLLILIVGVPIFFAFLYSDGKEMKFRETALWEWILLILIVWCVLVFVW